MIAQSSPRVSVVSAWYNRADYIRDTVDSLLAQDFEDFEIIIVNDGSPDPRVREILDSYDDPRLRVVHQENQGFVHAIRNAFALARAPFVALQGAGDVSDPQRLAAQHAFLMAHPDYAVVGCRYDNVIVEVSGRKARHPAKFRGQYPTARDIRRGNPFGHGEVMIRRSCYDEVGGYRLFFKNSQDKDLWLRLSTSYGLHILDRKLYDRRVFAADGIAADFKKTLVQIAYSRIADLCYEERMKGKEDSVSRYGEIALMRVPKSIKTTYRIISAMKQISFMGNNNYNLKYIYEIYGLRNFILSLFIVPLINILRILREK